MRPIKASLLLLAALAIALSLPLIQAQTASTLGYTTVATTTDSNDANYMTAFRFTMPATAGTATSISVYVASPVSAAPNNQYSLAIYTDSAGAPGSLVASTATDTLTGNAWNTLPITASLSASTSYWLAYNTNGASAANNNLRLAAGSTDQMQWLARAFGTWPATFGTASGSSSSVASIYVTYTTGTPPPTPPPTPPSAPTSLSATATSSSAISLTWTAASGATSYKVERATAAAGPFTQIGTPTANSYSDSALAASTAYYYRVRATNAAGDSAYSAVASATTQAASACADGEVCDATLYISPTGNDAQPCNNPTTAACRSLDRALSIAVSGDTILVAPGTYPAQTITAVKPGVTAICAQPNTGATSNACKIGDLVAAGGGYTLKDITIDVGDTAHNQGWYINGDGITFRNVRAHGDFVAGFIEAGVDGFTWEGGEWGDQNNLGGARNCMNGDGYYLMMLGTSAITNIVLRDLDVWPQQLDATPCNNDPLHMETIRVDGAINGMLIDRLRFHDGAQDNTATLYITNFRGGPPTNIIVQNSYFGTDGNSNVNIRGAGTVTFRYNTFTEGLAETNNAASFTAVGNAGWWQDFAGCFGTHTRNVWQWSTAFTCGTDRVVIGPQYSLSALGVGAEGAIQAGSTLIDAAETACAPTTDILGRPRPAGTACDAGAYEYQAQALPAAPTSLSATATSSSAISLTWTAASGATSYKVERATAAAGPFTQIGTPTANSYSDSALAASTAYYYRVRATNAAGDSAYSAVASATTQAGATTCATVSRHGITFTFSTAAPCGQFANGDWWVVGPVTITAMTPAASGSGASLRNGYMVDPILDGPQSLDGRAQQAANRPALPLTVQPQSTVVKAISEAGTDCTASGPHRGCLEVTATLTVLSAVPPDNGATVLRPSVAAGSKTLYSIANLRTDLLPQLPPLPASAGVPTYAQIYTRFEHDQNDNWLNVLNREMAPNQAREDYGAGKAYERSDAWGALLIQHTPAQEAEWRRALIAMVQIGLDSITNAQKGLRREMAGGQGGGNLLSAEMARILLNDPSLNSFMASAHYTTFGEWASTSRRINPATGQSVVLYGEDLEWCSPDYTNTGYLYWNIQRDGTGMKECPDPHGGVANQRSGPYPIYQSSGNFVYNLGGYIDGGSDMGFGPSDLYLPCCVASTLKSMAVFSRLVPALKGSGWSAFSEDAAILGERYVRVGMIMQPDPCAPLSQGGGPNPSRPGECILDPDLTPGSTFTSFSCQAGRQCGRFPGDQGHNSAAFPSSVVDALWDAYSSTWGTPTTTTVSWTDGGFDFSVSGALSSQAWDPYTNSRYVVVPAGTSPTVTVTVNSQMRDVNGALDSTGTTRVHIGTVAVANEQHLIPAVGDTLCTDIYSPTNAFQYTAPFAVGPVNQPTPVQFGRLDDTAKTFGSTNWPFALSNGVELWLIPSTVTPGTTRPSSVSNGNVPAGQMVSAPAGAWPALYTNAADLQRLHAAVAKFGTSISSGAGGAPYNMRKGANYWVALADDAATNALIGWHTGSATHLSTAKAQLLAVLAEPQLGEQVASWVRTRCSPTAELSPYGRDTAAAFFDSMIAASALGPNMANALTPAELSAVNNHLYSFWRDIYTVMVEANNYQADGGINQAFHPITAIGGLNWNVVDAQTKSSQLVDLTHNECTFSLAGVYGTRFCQGITNQDYESVGNADTAGYFVRFAEFFGRDVRTLGKNQGNAGINGLYQYALNNFANRAIPSAGFLPIHALLDNWVPGTSAPPTTPPSAPTSLSATATSSSAIALTWAASTGATSYKVERATAAAGPFTQIGTPTANSYSDSGLSASTQYFYRVAATNAAGDSAYSTVASATTPGAVPPAIPTGLTATATSSSSIALSWLVVSGATGYTLQRSPDSLSWTTIATPATSPAADSGLAASTTYFYRVAATNAAGASAYSAVASATTQAVGASSTLGYSTIGTTTDVADANSMTAFRFTMPATAGTAASISVYVASPVSAAPNNQYSLAIYTDSAGAPGSLVASTATGTLTGNAWNTLPITASLSAGATYWLAYNTNGASTADNNLRLAAGATNQMQWLARAFGTWPATFGVPDAGSSTVGSIYVTYTTGTPTTPPSAPTSLSATASSSSAIALTWAASTGATSYKVERATAAAGPFTQIGTPTANSYSDSGLTAGTQYFYRVAATNAAGDSAYSSIASATTQAPGASPYAQWANGPSTSPAFFPIGVFLQTPSTAASYKAIGINLFVGYFGDLPQSALTTLAAAQMPIVVTQNAVGLSSPQNSWIDSWLSPHDEPDNAQWNDVTQDYDPCIPTTTLATEYAAARATDPTRPFHMGFGRGAADTGWIGRGTCTGDTAYYVRAIPSSDITSFDIYPVNDYSGRLEYVAEGMDNLRTWATAAGQPNKIIWNYLETTAFNGGTPPTPAQIKAEVWMSLIHGSQGIMYFVHQFSPTFIEAGLLDPSYTPQRDAVATLNAQITALAPVLNSPTVPSGASASTSPSTVPVDVMVKQYGGSTYLFAVAMRSTATTATFTVSGLTSGTVEVIDEGRQLTLSGGRFTDAFAGYGVHLYKITAGTPPTAPATPTSLVAAPSGTQVALSWTASTGATSYVVERALASAGPWTQVGTPTTTAFTNTGLTAGTQYFYRVSATNAGGTSAPSAAASATLAPAIPTALTVTTQSSTQLLITWTPATGATSYTLRRATAAAGPFAQIATPTAATYTDAALAAGTTYYYTVSAANAGGTSAASTASSGATLPAAPAVPTGLSATASSSTAIALSWTASAGATSYVVERALASAGPWTQIATPATTTYTNTGLAASTQYFYRVSATNAGGTSAPSTAASATTRPAPPATPTGLTATASSSTAIQVSWAASAGAASYTLQRSATSATAGFATIGGTLTATAYADTGRTPSTQYWYRVRATNAGGTSAFSGAVTETTLPAAPAAPTGLSATATSSSAIALTWTASAGATGYKVQRSATLAGTYADIASPTATSYTDTALSPSTTYFYKLVATNAGGSSTASAAVSATTQSPPPNPTPPPATPTGLVATATDPTTISLSWTASASATAYDLERSPDSTAWSSIASPTATSYADTGRTPNTQYFYRVSATNAGGSSTASAAVSATTPIAPPAAPTTFTAAAASSTAISLSWSDVPAAATYLLERSTGAFTPVTILPAGTVSFTDIKLAPSTAYTYRLTARNAGGDAPPATAAATTQAAPPAVCGNAALEPPEQCDDGNLVPGDGCNAQCQLEPTCVDGLRNGDETGIDCGGSRCAACATPTCQNYPTATLPQCVSLSCTSGSIAFSLDNALCDDADPCTADTCTSLGCRYAPAQACAPQAASCTDADTDGVLDASPACSMGKDVCIKTPDQLTSTELVSLLPQTAALSASFDNAADPRSIAMTIRDPNSVFGSISFPALNAVTVDSTGCFAPLRADPLILISQGRIEVLAAAFPAFNTPATITFEHIPYPVPGILRNGAPCPECAIQSYANGLLTVTVPGFSTYEVYDATPAPSPSPPSGGSSSSGSSGAPSGGGSAATTKKPTPVIPTPADAFAELQPAAEAALVVLEELSRDVQANLSETTLAELKSRAESILQKAEQDRIALRSALESRDAAGTTAALETVKLDIHALQSLRSELRDLSAPLPIPVPLPQLPAGLEAVQLWLLLFIAGGGALLAIVAALVLHHRHKGGEVKAWEL